MYSAQLVHYRQENGEQIKDANLKLLEDAWIECAKSRGIDIDDADFQNGLAKALGNKNKIKNETKFDVVPGGKFVQTFSSANKPTIVADTGEGPQQVEACPFFENGSDIEVGVECSVFKTKKYGVICKAELAAAFISGEEKVYDASSAESITATDEELLGLFGQ